MVCMVLELFCDVQVVTSTYKVLLLCLFSSAVCPGFLCRLDLYVALFIAIHASFLTSCMPWFSSGSAEQMNYKRA